MSSERAAVRLGLINAGMYQIDIGYDEKGDGAYTEVWGFPEHGRSDRVIINWAPREA